MDYPADAEFNNLEKLLDMDHLQHGMDPLDPSNKPPLGYQISMTQSKQKKKGRPKGLKTNKSKSQQKTSENSQKNKGHWAYQQNKKYHLFLEIHSRHFIQKKLRRMDKIFKSMADFIGSREAEQCRSHHQKMEKKFKSFYKILKNLRYEFYSLPDPEYVKRDLQNNNIMEFDPLIAQEKLDDENEFEVDNSKEEMHGDYQLQPSKNMNEHKMLMSDCYEKQFRL